MVLLESNFPIAQGVFTALIVGIVLFVFKLINKGVDKTIDKAYLSSNNVEKLLHFALDFNKKGQIDDTIQAYKKVLLLEPVNSTALVSLGFINFQQNNFDAAEECYWKIYNHYFVNEPTAKNSLKEKPLSQLYISIYRLGYILNKKGLNEKSLELKKISLMNTYFVENYKNLRNEISY